MGERPGPSKNAPRRMGGTSLIEVVLALGLSSLVLMAIMSISVQMLRHHLHEIGAGAASSNALIALGHLNQDVANATYIHIDSSVDFPGGELSGCHNWSAEIGTRLAPSSLEYGDLAAFFYCFKPGVGATPGAIYRYFDDDGPCQFTPPGSSNCGVASGGVTPTLLARHVTKQPGYEIFSISTSPPHSLAVHFSVGLSTPTGVKKEAATVGTELRIDTFIRFNKSYKVPGG